MELKIDETYPLAIKKWWGQEKIEFEPCRIGAYKKIDKESQNSISDRLRIFGFEVAKVNRQYIYKFYASKIIEVCFVDFYYCELIDGRCVGIMEIMDICLNKKFRSKGAGNQIMSIFNKIALENGIDYIVGDLQKDEEREPMKARKRFFIKNGFNVEASQLSKFSGFIVKKYIVSEL
jgi:hypothetical protein